MAAGSQTPACSARCLHRSPPTRQGSGYSSSGALTREVTSSVLPTLAAVHHERGGASHGCPRIPAVRVHARPGLAQGAGECAAGH
eukprot:529601-Prorocentrum_minimum.AAC.5